MIHPASVLSLTGLLLALLRRWFGLWTHGLPPARLVRVMTQTEAELANAIRATLAEDGVAFPELEDHAFLKWFAKNAPGFPGAAQPHPGSIVAHFREWVPVLACGQTGKGMSLDRRLPAGLGFAGWKPAVQQARAPP